MNTGRESGTKAVHYRGMNNSDVRQIRDTFRKMDTLQYVRRSKSSYPSVAAHLPEAEYYVGAVSKSAYEYPSVRLLWIRVAGRL